MRRQCTLVGLAVLFLASCCLGQDIAISVPADPIPPGEYAQLNVSGLSDAELPATVVTWEPRAGVILIPARTWGGAPFLLFAAKQAGEYTVSITVNSWVSDLSAAVTAAKAAKIDNEVLAQLESVREKCGGLYPYRSGKAVVKVKSMLPQPQVGLTVPEQLREGETGTGQVSVPNRPDIGSVDMATDTDRLDVPRSVAVGSFSLMARQNAAVDGDVAATVTATAEDASVNRRVVVTDDDGQPPPGKRDVAVIYESESSQPPFVLTTQLVRTYCQKQGHTYRQVDDDAKAPDGTTPKWLAGYLEIIKQQGLQPPVLVVAAEWNGKTWVQARPMPETSEKAIQLIKELGG